MQCRSEPGFYCLNGTGDGCRGDFRDLFSIKISRETFPEKGVNVTQVTQNTG
jgi:hypothetical protein